GRLTAAAAGAGAPEADGGGLPATARRGPAAEPAPDLGACPECGKVLVRRQGRFGQFVSCSGYPTCRFRPPKGGAAA
ncbi:MAG TPA: topoisomerase DNA-binding C4 zinc finger domain-containing protein, partial [Candidatus Dormibacteraeota bacterium]|nr:topoisomerase DNA-binding C4 zinc finger domain-containing protein [Candidatus Dormibacteraeota bacterium]